MVLFAAGNPFVHAFSQSDLFGKCIFISLFFLSCISWAVLLHKIWLIQKVKKISSDFISYISEKDPLSLQFSRPVKTGLIDIPHPFFSIYKAYKTKALAIISRNHFFLSKHTHFSDSDVDLLFSEIHVTIAKQLKKLEQHLFVLSTVVTLGPFIGLLGTVWGILMSFSSVQAKAQSSEMMLGGISLALSTTVIGLVVAIPALVGYNYLRNSLKDYKRDMEDFGHLLVSSLELNYQKGENVSKDALIEG